MKSIYLVLFFTVILCISCVNNIVFEQKEKIEDDWNFDTELVYKIPVNDTLTKYDLIAKVTHSSDFSYQNFYVDLRTTFPNGKSLNDDVSFQLTDGMGSWQGRCSSSTCEVELLLQAKFRFQQLGEYTLGLRNNSREVLKGIDAVELRLEKIQEEKK